MPPCRTRKAALGKSGTGPKGLRHKWLRLDSEGSTLVLTAGKSHLTAKLGVQVCAFSLDMSTRMAPRHKDCSFLNQG